MKCKKCHWRIPKNYEYSTLSSKFGIPRIAPTPTRLLSLQSQLSCHFGRQSNVQGVGKPRLVLLHSFHPREGRQGTHDTRGPAEWAVRHDVCWYNMLERRHNREIEHNCTDLPLYKRQVFRRICSVFTFLVLASKDFRATTTSVSARTPPPSIPSLATMTAKSLEIIHQTVRANRRRSFPGEQDVSGGLAWPRAAGAKRPYSSNAGLQTLQQCSRIQDRAGRLRRPRSQSS